MTKILIEREVLENALGFVHCDGWSKVRDATIDAINAALAQASEPAQDSQPVAEIEAIGVDGGSVAWIPHNGNIVHIGDKLYASPQPQPSENEAAKLLRKDAERWQFTLWWQDQSPRPQHIQDELSAMHRWARQRGALGPNSEELQRATDNAITARAKGKQP